MTRFIVLFLTQLVITGIYSQPRPDFEVEPLLKTIRVQSAPFNRSCPYYNYGDSISSQPCLVGCVATALEQLLSYYRYPECLQDSLAGWETENYSISTVPSGTKIDWDDVADLSLWCGMMVKMKYTPTSSAAGLWRAEEPLRRVFGYKTVKVLDRSMYTYDDWHRILQNELMNNRPVAYVGYNNMLNGHAFNIDGVNEDGLYHCNWGEGEYDNGYFSLDHLCSKQPYWDETDWGRMLGYSANEYMLLLHPDSVTDVLSPDTLEDFSHTVRVDDITFRRPITARDYVLTDVTLTNLTDDTLYTTYELILNLPTDTSIIEQCKEVAISSVRLFPRETRTQVVAGRYNQHNGNAILRLTFDGEEFPFSKDVTIYPSQVDNISVKGISTMYDNEGTATIVFQINNTASKGTSGRLLYCKLFPSDSDNSCSSDYRILNLEAGKSVVDTLKFHRLTPEESYTLKIGGWSNPIYTYTFTIPKQDTGIEGITPSNNNSSTNSILYYNVDGRVVSKPRKGIYITNGKKIYYEGRRDN